MDNAYLVGFLLIFVVAVVAYVWMYSTASENFGALESLYSNYGLEDEYISIEDGCDGDVCTIKRRHNHRYPNYRYTPLNRYPWYMPTRGLVRVPYYPYFYGNYYLDMFGRRVPFPYE